MLIFVPVSVGELYDKITILKVKSERLTRPEQLRNVNRERTQLLELAQRDVEAATYFDHDELHRLVAELYEVNSTLWDIEDAKRAAEETRDFGPGFVELARKVYLLNDDRAAIKKSINRLVKSDIVEEKSHARADRAA